MIENEQTTIGKTCDWIEKRVDDLTKKLKTAKKEKNKANILLYTCQLVELGSRLIKINTKFVEV